MPSTSSKTKTIWYTRCPVPTAFGLAIRRGKIEREFAADGITLASLQQSTDLKVRESHFSHSLPDSFRHGGNTPAIWARSEGAETKIIGLSWTEQPHFILTLPRTGIRTVADLKGKRLALSRRKDDLIDFWRAAALRTYEVGLRTEGLTLDDVRLVDIEVQGNICDRGAAEAKAGLALNSTAGTHGLWRGDVFALVRGEVDAIYAQSSFGVEVAAFLDAHVVYDARKNPDALERSNNALPEAFTVSSRLIDEDPELVARVLARSLASAEWAKSHPRETLRFVALEQGLSEQIVEAATGDVLHRQLDVDLDPVRVAALGERKKFLLQHGFIRNDFDLDGWIDRRPLSRAREILKERAGKEKKEVSQALPERPVGAASCSL